MNKKAQESRRDLAAWYCVSLLAVVVIGTVLYGFNIIGTESGSTVHGEITGAVAGEVYVNEPVNVNFTAEANSSDNNTAQ
jgi:hypothetical protein